MCTSTTTSTGRRSQTPLRSRAWDATQASRSPGHQADGRAVTARAGHSRLRRPAHEEVGAGAGAVPAVSAALHTDRECEIAVVSDKPAVRLGMRAGSVLGSARLAVDVGREADAGRRPDRDDRVHHRPERPEYLLADHVRTRG